MSATTPPGYVGHMNVLYSYGKDQKNEEEEEEEEDKKWKDAEDTLSPPLVFKTSCSCVPVFLASPPGVVLTWDPPVATEIYPSGRLCVSKRHI